MELFDTTVLNRVVSELPAPKSFIFNSFFSHAQTEDSEDIHFDVDLSRPRLAPFVAPIVAGQIVYDQGYTTNTFRPAYIKDKRPFDANRPFKRLAGERIGGEVSPMQRLQASLGRSLMDQIAMLNRRQEVMAIETLCTGSVVITGERYPTKIVNFGRHPNLTVNLSGATRWGQTGVKPLKDIQNWSLRVAQKSGSTANIIVMDVKAWDIFSESAEVQKLLDRYRGKDQLNPTVIGQGARYMGNIGDYDLFVYAGWYEHPDTGVLTAFLPDYTVLVLGQDLEGTRAYGAIRDEEAGFKAMPYFTKSWLEKDPAARLLLMQSAPLPVPYRVNASLAATVATD